MALAELTILTIKVKVEICPSDFRYRSNWRGRLILQCMERREIHSDQNWKKYEWVWRDAKVGDLAKFITTEKHNDDVQHG